MFNLYSQVKGQSANRAAYRAVCLYETGVHWRLTGLGRQKTAEIYKET
jgi:hypothetical protein